MVAMTAQAGHALSVPGPKPPLGGTLAVSAEALALGRRVRSWAVCSPGALVRWDICSLACDTCRLRGSVPGLLPCSEALPTPGSVPKPQSGGASGLCHGRPVLGGLCSHVPISTSLASAGTCWNYETLGRLGGGEAGKQTSP